MDTFDKERVHGVINHSLPWYRTPSLIKLYLLVLTPLLTSTTNGFDISMTNSLQSVSQFMNRFDNPAGARLGFYGACTSIGGIVATLIAGPLCDRFGRRALVFVGSGLVIAMAIMETFASSFSIFMAGKLLLGFGGTLSQVTSPVLVVELAHPKSRIAISGIYNTSIYLGEIIGAWITYATFRIHGNWSWKIPCILQCVFPLYEFCTIWFCPESPRWLVSKDRIEEARAILIKYHGNGEETELVKDELREIIAGVNADATEMSFSKSGLRSILGSTGNLHRLWICFWTAVASQCAGSGLIMYYLPDILDQVGISSSKNKTLINGCVDIWSWVIGIIASVTMPYMRRRSILMFCTVGMLFTFIAWTALTAEYLKTGAKAYGVGVVAMIFVFNLFFSFCWLPLVITYPMEVVTTKQRGVFFAFTMFVINASNFVVTYINPVGLANISWRYYVIQTVFIAILLIIVYFTFVETNGLTLEEIATVFDGEEAFANAAEIAKKEVTSHEEEIPTGYGVEHKK